MITKWYLPERDSAAALRIRAGYAPPAVLTHLHSVELTTAWHAKVFRREIDLETVVQVLADLERDVEDGLWESPAYDLVEVHDAAERLARRYAAVLSARSLDILHVAAAMRLDKTDFVTADRNQGALAKAAGLEVTLLSARR